MRTKKHFRWATALLAVMMALFAVTPMTAFAYTNEAEADSATEMVATTDSKESTEGTKDSTSTNGKDEAEASLAYEIISNEDGTITVAIGDKKWTFDPDKMDETVRTGTVVNVNSYLHLRDGAGMDANIIGHLLNGDTMEIIGQDGDWYQVIVPEQTGYVHSSYVAVAEAAATGEDGEVDEDMMSMLLYLMLAGMDGNSKTSTSLTPDGNLTLIDDIGSSTGEGQQFITVESKSGNTFYLIIDRNDKGDENVHFLNLVDEADLMALMEDGEVTVKCTCNERCEAGHVDMNCAVCRNNMSECTGKEKTVEQETEPETVVTPETEEKSGSGMGGLVLFLTVAAAGAGGAVYYLKFRKPKADTKGDTDLDDYDFGEDEEDEDDVEYVTEDELDDIPEIPADEED